MLTSDLQYDLPPELIAQRPAKRRDASRLLIFDRYTGDCLHQRFADLPDILSPGALLVLNDTRVLPARLHLQRSSGGRLVGLYLHEPRPGQWDIMLSHSGRLKPGEELQLLDPTDRNHIQDSEVRPPQRLRLMKCSAPGVWLAEPVPSKDTLTILARHGRPPLPPYIHREGQQSLEQAAEDLERYQTIYARQPGAVAAPTAGLHFTPELFARLKDRGIHMTSVTLHVGVGTFAPIRCKDLADHDIHAEWYECQASAADKINRARREGRTVIAVGTTAVRVIESCADATGQIIAGNGWTRLFIYPPYRFRAVDAMVTNFHLPGSTLLALIFAFAGQDSILTAYREAIRQQYRFYTYGDAMFIR